MFTNNGIDFVTFLQDKNIEDILLNKYRKNIFKNIDYTDGELERAKKSKKNFPAVSYFDFKSRLST